MKKLFFRIPRRVRIIMGAVAISYIITSIVLLFNDWTDHSWQIKIGDALWEPAFFFFASLLSLKDISSLFNNHGGDGSWEGLGQFLALVFLGIELFVTFISLIIVLFFTHTIYPWMKRRKEKQKKARGKKRK